MNRPVSITHEHIERAYAQLRRLGWPTLAELERCHKLYLAVRGQAVNVACGKPLPPEPVSHTPPLPQANAPPPRARRRDDTPSSPAPFDPRAAAAGEYLHPDEETS